MELFEIMSRYVHDDAVFLHEKHKLLFSWHIDFQRNCLAALQGPTTAE